MTEQEALATVARLGIRCIHTDHGTYVLKLTYRDCLIHGHGKTVEEAVLCLQAKAEQLGHELCTMFDTPNDDGGGTMTDSPIRKFTDPSEVAKILMPAHVMTPDRMFRPEQDGIYWFVVETVTDDDGQQRNLYLREDGTFA